jgi:hypothetical protein
MALSSFFNRVSSFLASVLQTGQTGLRCTPLRSETAKMLEAWLRERHGLPEDSVFPSIRGGTLSRDAIERLITKYTHLAAETCPSLKGKRVSSLHSHGPSST